MMKKLSHTDSKGNAKMVDVGSKKQTKRTAEAFAQVFASKEVLNAISSNEIKKGDVLTAAKLAGIQAAKKTSELIPLCHNIFLSNIEIDFEINMDKLCINIKSIVNTISVTGVEMEALTAVSIAALTVYDMCKAIDKSIVISNLQLLSKTGGKSGVYRRRIIHE